MNPPTHRLIRTALFGFVMLCTGSLTAATLTWSVVIIPTGGGTVDWTTSSPAASGTLTNSGSVKFNANSYVDLTFKAKPGFQLQSVYKNLESWINFLDQNNHFQFGPVGAAHTITVVFSKINPTGNFKLAFPDGGATTIVDITGNYSGETVPSRRGYNVDVAMDEAGKVSVMGVVDGIVPTGGGQLQGALGSITTAQDKPTAQFTGSFTGTKDGVASTASGSVSGPVDLHPASGGNSTASGLASGTAKVGTVPYSVKATTTNFPVTASQAANLSKAWDLTMTLREMTDPRTGTNWLVASSVLTLPSHDQTAFGEKTVPYVVGRGYSVAFSSGTKLDAAGNPLLDPVTHKPVVDTKSSVTITNMNITGTQGHWIVTGGTINYKFLGQTGKGDVMNFTGPEETIFNNRNNGAVVNTPTQPTTFTINSSYAVTYLNTYHWNFGRGTTKAGTLSLRRSDGTIYGPWQATGIKSAAPLVLGIARTGPKATITWTTGRLQQANSAAGPYADLTSALSPYEITPSTGAKFFRLAAASGTGGVTNAVWECRPGAFIPAGTYTVVDSDPATWSQNGASGGQGFAEVRGKP